MKMREKFGKKESKEGEEVVVVVEEGDEEKGREKGEKSFVPNSTTALSFSLSLSIIFSLTPTLPFFFIFFAFLEDSI